MTNKEAKEKAIREAWGLYWSNTGLPRLTKRQKQIALKNNGWVEWFGPDDDNLEFRSKDYCSRPRILRNIDNNNGWTRIEPDGSNLPKEVGLYNIVNRWGSITKMVNAYLPAEWPVHQFTHFKPIEEEKPPIY